MKAPSLGKTRTTKDTVGKRADDKQEPKKLFCCDLIRELAFLHAQKINKRKGKKSKTPGGIEPDIKKEVF